MNQNSLKTPRSEEKYRLRITHKRDRVIIHLPIGSCGRSDLPKILFAVVWLVGWGFLGFGNIMNAFVEGREPTNFQLILALALVTLAFLLVAIDLAWTLRGGVRECVVMHKDLLTYCADGVHEIEKAKVARTEVMPIDSNWTVRVIGAFWEFHLGKNLTQEEGHEIRTWLEEWRTSQS